MTEPQNLRPRCTADDAELQNMVISELLREVRPQRGLPTVEYTISADGTRLTLRGPYAAIWYTARFSGELRRTIEDGANDVEFAVAMGGTEVIVHYLVTDR